MLHGRRTRCRGGDVGSFSVIGIVARDTVRICNAVAAVGGRMTFHTGGRRMRRRQGESSRRVIKRASRAQKPCGRDMARLAGCRQHSHMGWVFRTLVIGLVTAKTVGIGAQGAVVKKRSGKGGRGMTITTGVSEIHRDVIRRFLIIRLMAGVAVYRGSTKVLGVSTGMTLDT